MGERLSNARLCEGDLLVLCGRPSHFNDLAAHRGFLTLVPIVVDAQRRLRAPRTPLALVSTLDVAASN